NVRWNKIYSDDVIFEMKKEEPYYEALKETFKIQEAYPEGPDRLSNNPRMHVIDEKYFDQSRPDFIGPKEAQYHVPAGPLLYRCWLAISFNDVRELKWNVLAEQAAGRRNNRRVRQMIRDHERNCRNRATCRICNKP
ncbi:hypothetical protein PMAYCL1PPCAC_25047, partial [Pristionchus mayeri]